MVSAAIPWGAAAKVLGQQTARIAQGMPRVAQNAGQGFQMGAGFAAGQLVAKPIQGTFSWVLNWFPENIAGWMMWGALVLYFFDWRYFNFDIGAAANMHLVFAAIFFIAFGITMEFMNLGIAATAIGTLMALVGFMNADGQKEKVFALVALVIALYFYWKWTAKFMDKPGADYFRYLPLLAFVDVYAMPLFRDKLVAFAGNINAVSYAVAFFFNRLLFPMWIYFTASTLYNNTRVAKRVFIAILLFYFIAFLPTVTSAYNAKVAGLTPEEKEVAQGIFARFQANFQRIISGEFLKAPVASAYGGLERTFGFGEPKQEPKLGLALVQDSTMLKKYDISYKKPEPSFVMRITSPFPASSEKPYIEVTGINCNDKQNKLKFKPGITSKGVTPTEGKPVAVFYNGPDGGAQVKCPVLDDSKWESGDYTISAEVNYKVDATAFLTTAFIRADQDEALRKQGIDPAVVNKIPPAAAKYDNVPVTLTWGPPDLTKSPASVNLGEPAATDSEIPELAATQTATSQNLLITVYVSKSSGWEGSEIKEVKELMLTLPPGVSLNDLDNSCDFKLKSIDMASLSIIYTVKEDRISKSGQPRFIGDAIRFECGMKVGNSALSGADWAPARFDVTGSFIFTTKLDSITFTVEEREKAVTQQPAASGTTAIGTTQASPSTPPSSVPAAPAQPSAATT